MTSGRTIAIAALAIGTYIALGCKAKKDDEPIGEKPAPATPASVDAKPVAMCGDKPCLPVPTGLKGLSFGMTRAEAAAAIGTELTRAGAKRVTVPDELVEEADRLLPYNTKLPLREVPGSVSAVTTTLGSQRAECLVHFSEADRVEGIECTVKSDFEEMEGNQGAIAQSLLRQYGEPTVKSNDNATWVSSEAVLFLRRDWREMQIENRSRAHHERIAKLQQSIFDEIKSDAEARAKEAQRKAEEAQRRRDEAKKTLDRDLGTSPERPR